jgi:TonB family protein
VADLKRWAKKMKFVPTTLLLLLAGCASEPRFAGGGLYPSPRKVEVSVLGVVDAVDYPPVMKASPVPILYPFEMDRAFVTGEVFARAIIQPDGRVTSVLIDQASQPDFEKSVLSGLPKCDFFPATRGGLPVSVTAQFKVRFYVEDE